MVSAKVPEVKDTVEEDLVPVPDISSSVSLMWKQENHDAPKSAFSVFSSNITVFTPTCLVV